MKDMNFIKKEIIFNYVKENKKTLKRKDIKILSNRLNRIFNYKKLDKSDDRDYDHFFKFFILGMESFKFFEDLNYWKKKLNLKLKNFQESKILLFRAFTFLVSNTKNYNYSYYYLHLMPFFLKFYGLYFIKFWNFRKKISKFNNLYNYWFWKFLKKDKIINLNSFNSKFIFFFYRKIFFFKKILKIKTLITNNLNSYNNLFFFFLFNFFLYKLLLLLYIFWFNKILYSIDFIRKEIKLMYFNDYRVNSIEFKIMRFYNKLSFLSQYKMYQKFPGYEQPEVRTLNMISYFYIYNNYNFFSNLNV
jgi:hypothetical protein